MKKRLLALGAFFILISQLASANPAEVVEQLTLENGMTVFLLQNPSDAVINIDFICKAGFSSQNQETNGFFKLFTRCLTASNPELHFSSASCTSDSSRYTITTSPVFLEKTLHAMAEAFFNPQFSDQVVSKELSDMKKEVSENATTMSYYINAAIDSRIFSDAPWKHDSGIYPSIFKKTSQKQARNNLKQIAERWYIPQNSALFISGNINPERLEIILKNSFGRFYSAAKIPLEKDKLPFNQQRNFVFHSKEISPDLTQLVVQYTMLSADECDLLAQILNDDKSLFKAKLLEEPLLNIPGDEYINASSIHEKDNSRLIIQTLLQKPEDKKLKTNSTEQTLAFLQTIYKLPELISEEEFLKAKAFLNQQIENLLAEPRSFMTEMADFWIREQYYTYEDDGKFPHSPLVENFMSEKTRLSELSLQTCFNSLKAENPFVFVIINSDDYKNTKKLYTNEKFEEINEGNSSWYFQSLFREVKNQTKLEELPEYITSRSELFDNSYSNRNLAQFEESRLSNGILVIKKQNPISTRTSLLLNILGGKINSADNHGFEEVMVQLLAGMIQKELSSDYEKGLLTGLPQVSAKTDLATSSITINFLPEDSRALAAGIVNAIIYGEIPPAMADRAVSSRQYKKRLENGSAVNQIFYGATTELYRGAAGASFANIFETEKDVLQTTNYSTILTAYPQFLDANRYSIIITGKIENGIDEALEEAFGQLEKSKGGASLWGGRISGKTAFNPSLQRGRSKIVSIVHTFLTDIPAEEAGPMPAELIPTTEFLDPVLYIYEAPEAKGESQKDAALYRAVLNYMEDFFNFYGFDSNVIFPRYSMPFGSIIFQNVEHTKEADAKLRRAFSELKAKLMSSTEAAETCLQIKEAWNLKQMKQSGSDEGTANLIQKGFELNPLVPNPKLYLEEYTFIQNANAQDFLEILKYFSDKPNLSVYSKDSKK